MSDHKLQCTAFVGFQRIASGELAHVAVKTKEVIDRGEQAPILIFDDVTSEPVEIDFRGTVDDVSRTLVPPEPAPRGPGRPRLGVVAREVTLLPRHWDWLNTQPGGASVALRKLVEEARHANEHKDRVRDSQKAAYQFMSAIAGNLPGFEEATRALFAGSGQRFSGLVAHWPTDVRDHARKLASVAFEATPV